MTTNSKKETFQEALLRLAGPDADAKITAAAVSLEAALHAAIDSFFNTTDAEGIQLVFSGAVASTALARALAGVTVLDLPPTGRIDARVEAVAKVVHDVANELLTLMKLERSGGGK